MEILAIIPARGGSKGIPGKNVIDLAGRPLLAWTLEAARACRTPMRVVVSTEDPRIAEVAARYGGEVPFLRPAELAADETPGVAPVTHALDWLRAEAQYIPDVVVLLQPTSPFRTAEDIEGALDLLTSRGAESVVSVTEVSEHPHWMQRLDVDGWLRPFIASDVATRRQDLPPLYRLNGAIYAVHRPALERTGGFQTNRTAGYVMPDERSLDIDTPWDLRLARAIAEGF